jgi:hypothetical protein
MDYSTMPRNGVIEPTAIPKIARAASVQKLTTKAQRTQRASGSEKAMADCGLFDALAIGEAGTNLVA